MQIFQRTFIGDNQGALALAATAVNAGNLPRYALDIVSDAAALIGDYDVSLDYCLRLNPQFRDNPNIHIDRLNVDNAIKFGWLLLQQGDAGRARPVLTKALNVLASMPRQGHEGHGIRDVQVLALLDRGDEAMATLREAVDVGFRGSEPFDHWTLVTDPYLQVLRERPEFAAIVEEISVDVNAMHENVTQARQSGSWSALLDKTRASVAQ